MENKSKITSRLERKIYRKKYLISPGNIIILQLQVFKIIIINPNNETIILNEIGIRQIQNSSYSY